MVRVPETYRDDGRNKLSAWMNRNAGKLISCNENMCKTYEPSTYFSPTLRKNGYNQQFGNIQLFLRL